MCVRGDQVILSLPVWTGLGNGAVQDYGFSPVLSFLLWVIQSEGPGTLSTVCVAEIGEGPAASCTPPLPAAHLLGALR